MLLRQQHGLRHLDHNRLLSESWNHHQPALAKETYNQIDHPVAFGVKYCNGSPCYTFNFRNLTGVENAVWQVSSRLLKDPIRYVPVRDSTVGGTDIKRQDEFAMDSVVWCASRHGESHVKAQRPFRSPSPSTCGRRHEGKHALHTLKGPVVGE